MSNFDSVEKLMKKKTQSTADIMKWLVRYQKEYPKVSIDKKNVGEAAIARIEESIASLDKKNREISDTLRNISQTTGDVQATLDKVGNIRATLPYHAQYKPKIDVILLETKERFTQNEALKIAIQQFIDETRKKLNDLRNDNNISESEITNEIYAIEKQARVIIYKTAGDLKLNTDYMLEKLQTLHKEIYNTLPAHEKIGLKSPRGIEGPIPETSAPKPD